MAISAFELYTIGVGPSSSHTIGPMRAANAFVQICRERGLLKSCHQLNITLYGSLAHTGEGHGTLPAMMMGFRGAMPEDVMPESILAFYAELKEQHCFEIAPGITVQFNPAKDCEFNKKELLPRHSNALRIEMFAKDKKSLLKKTYYSIGGGFIVDECDADKPPITPKQFPYPFETAAGLLGHCRKHHLTIAQLMRANELALQPEAQVIEQLRAIENVMHDAIRRGCTTTGILPGVLKVRRRAPELYRKLNDMGMPETYEHIDSMSWLNLYALAVNEENAAGGRVVTAPTNGASGIIPAVLQYYRQFYPGTIETQRHDFLLTAAAIGVLYKKGASISGAEVGCQGEVGVASSMAAGALTAVLGGTLAQVEQAAEIAMEHHLGMTCDPVAGLVQIPCIERNAMGAVKAVNASRLALLEEGDIKITLDKVIATMKQTGKDMNSIYKETSLGGLAVNVSEC